MFLKPVPIKIFNFSCILVIFLLIFSTGCNVTTTATPIAGHWYVSPDGDDNNQCHTALAPCKTIAAALDKASEGDTIYLAEGTYPEALSVTKSVTITGELAASDAIIDGTGKGKSVVNVNCFACFIHVTFAHLIIQNGKANTGGGMTIVNAEVLLQSVIVRNNEATQAGGGVNILNGATLKIVNSSIEDNEAKGITEYSGGAGIYNLGILFMTNVSVEGNSAHDLGGGLNNQGAADLTTVTFTGNETHGGTGGGGIYNAGTLSMNSCVFQDNLTDENNIGDGGAILNAGTAVINGLEAYSNTAGGFGGAVANEKTGVLTLNDATLSGNSADMGGGIVNDGGQATLGGVLIYDNTAKYSGGGIINTNHATMNIFNATLSENTAGDLGGGIANGGASANMFAVNVTIASNSAENSFSHDSSPGSGIHFLGGLTNFVNVLLAYNTGRNCGGADIDGGMNLSSDSSCQFSGYANIYNIDPLLDPLADNGGSTMTRALQIGSPAIDTGTEWLAPHVDQRGVERPIDGNLDGIQRTDIGAFEFAYQTMSAQVTIPPVTPTLWPILFTPSEKIRCRTGPGDVYPTLITLPAGEPAQVEGRSEDFGWFLVNLDGINGCWVFSDFGSLNGDPAWLAVVEAPPTPTYVFSTPTFTPQPYCSSFTTLETCNGHGCKWLDGGCHNP
jgi:hypothetical protein